MKLDTNTLHTNTTRIIKLQRNVMSETEQITKERRVLVVDDDETYGTLVADMVQCTFYDRKKRQVDVFDRMETIICASSDHARNIARVPTSAVSITVIGNWCE